MSTEEPQDAEDPLISVRRSFDEALQGLKMGVFEAVRAQTVNRYKLEEVLKKYFDRHQKLMEKICDRLEELSKPRP